MLDRVARRRRHRRWRLAAAAVLLAATATGWGLQAWQPAAQPPVPAGSRWAAAAGEFNPATGVGATVRYTARAWGPSWRCTSPERTCLLGVIGHARDGVRGRLQIVYGMLTTTDGIPVAVEVFKGNTGDPTTVGSQITKLKERFGLAHVAIVGRPGDAHQGPHPR